MPKQYACEAELAAANRAATKEREAMEAADILKMINGCKRTSLKDRFLKSINYQTRHDGSFKASVSFGHVAAVAAAAYVGVMVVKAIKAN